MREPNYPEGVTDDSIPEPGWKSVIIGRDDSFDICECGHAKNAHNGRLMRGRCTAGFESTCGGNGRYCMRFKLAKAATLDPTGKDNGA